MPFQPATSLPPFQFQATLDGAIYTVQTKWNVTGQRWYVYIYDQSANLIVTLPMIGSPTNYDISLTDGYFTTTLVFRVATQSFEVGS